MDRLIILLLIGIASVSIDAAPLDDLGCNIPPTCADVLAAKGPDGTYEIDPDGPDFGVDPFKVNCEGGVTQVIPVNNGDGPVDSKDLQVIVEYGPSLEQIQKLIEVSDCTQELRLDCAANAPFRDEGGKQLIFWEQEIETEVPEDRWIKKANWGGAPSTHKGCGCSYDKKECTSCQCDDPKGPTQDGGLLRESLPVRRLDFLAYPNREASYFCGQLNCESKPQIVQEPKKIVKPQANEEDCEFLKGANRFEFQIQAKGAANVNVNLKTADGAVVYTLKSAFPADNAASTVTFDEGDVTKVGPALSASGTSDFWVSTMNGRLQVGKIDEVTNGIPFVDESLDAEEYEEVCFDATDVETLEILTPPNIITERTCAEDLEAKKTINCVDKFIDIQYANFGRLDDSVCGAPEGAEQCRTDEVFNWVFRTCHNKESCELDVLAGDYESDCPKDTSYFDVRYRCVEFPRPETSDIGPCHENRCSKNAKCEPNGDKYDCVCNEGFEGTFCGEPTKYCMGKGDPHYTAYNGQKYDFQSDECPFLFTKPAGQNAPWKVEVLNKKTKPSSRVSKTYTVIATIENWELVLGQRCDVTLEDKDGDEGPQKIGDYLPAADVNNAFKLSKDSKEAEVLSSKYHFKLTWDCKSTVQIEVAEDVYADQNLRGLCGTVDGTRGILYQLERYEAGGNEVVKKIESSAKMQSKFGNSWGRGCEGSPPQEPPVCEADSKRQEKGVEACAPIDPRTQDGPFSEAIGLLVENHMEELENWWKECVFDQCVQFDGDDNDPQDTEETMDLRCEAFSNLAEYIMNNLRGQANIDEWFEKVVPQCEDVTKCEDENQEYHEDDLPCDDMCGESSKGRRNRCKQHVKEKRNHRAGCACKKNFKKLGSKCVPAAECSGCQYRGKIYQVGEAMTYRKGSKDYSCPCEASGMGKCKKVKRKSRKHSKKGKSGKKAKKAKKSGSSSSKSGSDEAGVRRVSKKGGKAGKKGGKAGKKGGKAGKRGGSGGGSSNSGSSSSQSGSGGSKSGSDEAGGMKAGKKGRKAGKKGGKAGKRGGSGGGSSKSGSSSSQSGSGDSKSGSDEAGGMKAGKKDGKFSKKHVTRVAGGGSGKSGSSSSKSGSGGSKSGSDEAGGMKAGKKDGKFSKKRVAGGGSGKSGSSSSKSGSGGSKSGSDEAGKKGGSGGGSSKSKSGSGSSGSNSSNNRS